MAKTASEVLKDVARREKVIKQKWLDDAKKVIDIYEAEEGEKIPFNILYSNTETILPALYNSTPRPEVSKRHAAFGRNSSLDSFVAQAAERLLEYVADSNVSEYENFDAAVRNAVLKALVPGMGIVRVRYKEDGGFQEICYESVPYDRFIWGFARKWSDVPWVAFGYDMSRVDFERQFPEFTKTKDYNEFRWEAASEDISEEDIAKDDTGTRKQPTLLVWEVWNAETKEVSFVCEKFRDSFIKQEAYPFELTSRFPAPKPIAFVQRTDNLMPVPPYSFYEKQAKELNEVTRRLHLVLKAIKVRGGYNAQLSEIGTILDSDDTTLVPIENASMISESGGLEKQIWLMPIRELVEVARSLYEAQQATKNTIYEITGISDILRGTSAASETAKAQEIKNQWGSLRIKRLQRDVMSFCRDLFRITLEFAANLYTPATFAQITKLELPTEGQKRLLAQQPTPETERLLAMPAWEEVLAVLRDRFERTYRIDIETNSTVDLEATEDKAQIAEFMNAWGQMMSGITPLVETGAMPFEAAKLVMSEVFRRFRFARRVEQALMLMQPPQPKEDPKVIEEKARAMVEKVQAESKRQIGEMQETVLELTAELERVRIENFALKKTGDLVSKEAAVDAKTREFQLRTDYAGKMAMAKDQVQKLQTQQQAQAVQSAFETGAAELQKLSQSIAQQLAQSQEAVKPLDNLQAAIEQLVAGQSAMMEALKQVALLAAAPREAEIFVGPDGKKRSRSIVVLQ